MPSNLLLLLPLLGGYAFIHLFYRTHFRAQGLDGHRLIFEAAVAGFVAILPARVLVYALKEYLGFPAAWWTEATGDTPFLGTLVVAVVLCPMAAWGANILVGLWRVGRRKAGDRFFDYYRSLLEASRVWARDRAIKRSGSDLQKILHDAALRADAEGMMVGVTMSDRKLYVGWMHHSPDLRPNEQYLSLLPAMSGYRKPDSLEVQFQTPYPVDKYWASSEEGGVDPNDYIVVLPISEIHSVRLVEARYHQRFFPGGGPDEDQHELFTQVRPG